MPKIKASDGQDVDVAVIPAGSGDVVKIQARVGNTLYEHIISFGAVDQPLPANYGAKEAQADVDKAKQFAADMVASAERRKSILQQLN